MYEMREQDEKKDKLANLFKLVRVHLLRVHYGISLCVEFVIIYFFKLL